MVQEIFRDLEIFADFKMLFNHVNPVEVGEKILVDQMPIVLVELKLFLLLLNCDDVAQPAENYVLKSQAVIVIPVWSQHQVPETC